MALFSFADPAADEDDRYRGAMLIADFMRDIYIIRKGLEQSGKKKPGKR